MRLLDTHTGRFVEKDPRKKFFKYAILSHTWDPDGEQTHKELKKIQKRYVGECLFPAQNGPDGPVPPLSAIWQDPDLSPKIRDACRVAREDGYRYAWIDSCCIDKTSSSELSEAINSMFAWYKGAKVCYAYLVDVPLEEVPYQADSAFRQSRWFKRGWTLQELLAPWNLIFLSRSWIALGSREEFAELVNAITDISTDALSRRKFLYEFSVAQRLSWAARRETTRVEDRTYSLMGIFDINMPTLYGEGEGAFRRLQEEILRRIPDQSVFMWGNSAEFQTLRIDILDAELALFGLKDDFRRYFVFESEHSPAQSFLSTSPSQFVEGRSIDTVPLRQLFHHFPDLPFPDYVFTPHGIRTHLPLIPLSAVLPDAYEVLPDWYLAILGCEHVDCPGHILGRICCVKSPTSDLRHGVLSTGAIMAYLTDKVIKAFRSPFAELVALPAKALARLSASAKVVPVHIPYPNEPSRVSPDRDRFNCAHKVIILLLKKDHATASSSGLGPRSDVEKHRAKTPSPSLSLRWPDRDHQDTHWLTISRPAAKDTAEVQDTITVEYRHVLGFDGKQLTIVAYVSGMLQGRPIVPITSTWNNSVPWKWEHKKRILMLDNEKGGTAVLELTLEYLSRNHYVIDAYTEWCNESPRTKKPCDSDSEEEYFTAEEE